MEEQRRRRDTSMVSGGATAIARQDSGECSSEVTVDSGKRWIKARSLKGDRGITRYSQKLHRKWLRIGEVSRWENAA